MDDFEMDYERFEDDLYEWETEQVFQDGGAWIGKRAAGTTTADSGPG